MIGKTLRAALQQDGYAVDWVKDGQAGRLALDTAEGAYALVLLDLGLPRKSGLELLRELRRAGNKVRVLVVTARDAVTDRVAGLDAGADDYLVKPFSLDELAARMRALLRRDVARGDNVLRNGDLALDPAARTVTRAGLPVDLSIARVRAAGGAAGTAGHGAVQGAARGAPVWLGRRSGKQRGRGARPQSAQEAGRRRDPHDPRRRLRDRHGHDVDPADAARLAAAGPRCRGRGGDARHLCRNPARDRRTLRPAAEAARLLDPHRRPAARAAAEPSPRDGGASRAWPRSSRRSGTATACWSTGRSPAPDCRSRSPKAIRDVAHDGRVWRVYTHVVRQSRAAGRARARRASRDRRASRAAHAGSAGRC